MVRVLKCRTALVRQPVEAVLQIIYMPIPAPPPGEHSDSELLAYAGDYLRREQPKAFADLLLSWSREAERRGKAAGLLAAKELFMRAQTLGEGFAALHDYIEADGKEAPK